MDVIKPKSKCSIAEIVQHTCELKTDANGNRSIHCFPIPRILKLCPGQPAFEITKFIKIDSKSGEVEVPPGLSFGSVKARPWREVSRYEESMTEA